MCYYTGENITNYKNTEHHSENEKKVLAKLMSQFERLLQATVGDYKEIEVSFGIDLKKRVLTMQNLTVFQSHIYR